MNPEVQPPRLIKGHVQEELLEARRRTALYCRIKQQISLDELSEDDLADMQPSGATVLYLFGAVAALAAGALIIAAFVLFGSRTVLAALAVTGLVLLCCVVSSIRRLRQDNRRALRLENEYGSRVGTLERRSVPRS
jgi:hypothetical protein